MRGGGMTFAEIGKEIGVSGKRAEFIFKRAMRKLSRNQYAALLALRDLAQELRRNELNGQPTPRSPKC